MKSVNVLNGKTTISELEAMFILADRAFDKILEEKPNAGYIISKGNPNETRMKYAEAKNILMKLRDSFGMEGCFSFGICQTCNKFKPTGNDNKFGRCGDKTVGVYHTCSNHSKKGGGFGL